MSDVSERAAKEQRRFGKKPREIPPYPAENVMNLSGRLRCGSQRWYNIYYSHCTSCRHKQCIMDQISLLNSALITSTLRVHTIHFKYFPWPGSEPGIATVRGLELGTLAARMNACKGLTICTSPLPHPHLPAVNAHLQRRRELVLNYKQVCFLPSFVLQIIPWARTVHNKGWNNKPLSWEKTGK